MKKPVVVAPAPPDQVIDVARVSSGKRGKPIESLLSKIEAKYPGIEKEIGVSSAAARAGRHVREMRLANGWTQAQLAEKLGWEQVRISNIERGEGSLGPSFDVLQKIATTCGYELEFKPRRTEKPPGYVDMLQDIARRVAATGVLPSSIVATPTFAAACMAFGASLELGKTHFRTSQERKKGMQDFPFMEMAAHGMRMVMLPVLVEGASNETGQDGAKNKGAEVEVKLAVPKS